MFGIGGTELLVILVVALLVLGPKSVPQIARTLGRVMGEFRRVSTEFQRTLNTEIDLDEHEKRKQEAEKDLFPQTEPATPPVRATPPPGSAPTPSETASGTAPVASSAESKPSEKASV